MGIYETFKTDAEAERVGVWKEFPANTDGSIPAFRIARMAASNPEYQKRLEAAAKKYRVEMTLDVFTESQAFEPMLEVFVDTILVDWRNVQDPAGNDIEYTKENAKRLMRDLPDLYTLLREYASRISSFRDADIEARTGNS